jgi:hypothetical protein
MRQESGGKGDSPMKALIAAVHRTLPGEMHHLRFKNVVIEDDSVTLFSRDTEINVSRDDGIDKAVMKYLWKMAA